MSIVEVTQDGRDQIVKLPKAFRLKDGRVFVKRLGNAVVLLPCNDPWQPLFDSLDKFSDDFMEEREQPAQQERWVTGS